MNTNRSKNSSKIKQTKEPLNQQVLRKQQQDRSQKGAQQSQSNSKKAEPDVPQFESDASDNDLEIDEDHE